MDKIKNYINSEIYNTENMLKKENGDKEKLVSYKNELLDILFLIDISEKYNIKRKSVKEIYTLVQTSMSFSEYRIMDDSETEERKYWKELEIDGETLRLYGYDIVIKTKC